MLPLIERRGIVAYSLGFFAAPERESMLLDVLCALFSVYSVDDAREDDGVQGTKLPRVGR